jgi:hypothetical protein
MSRLSLRLPPVALVLAAAATGGACHRGQPLSSVVFGSVYVFTRTTMENVGTFDQPMTSGMTTGLVALRIDSPSTVSCMPAVDSKKLAATANGTPMKLDSAGGSHTEHPMGPDHFPTKQEICDPIRFTLPRENIKAAEDGSVAFDVTDGDTTIHLVWAHLFEKRRVTLVDHPPTVKSGEHLTLRWSPADDKLQVGDAPVRVCLQPDPGTTGCPKSLNGSQCTDGRLSGRNIDFEVPASWSCAPGGGVWVSGIHPSANDVTCDPRFKACRADLAPAVEHLPVRVTQ